VNSANPTETMEDFSSSYSPNSAIESAVRDQPASERVFLCPKCPAVWAGISGRQGRSCDHFLSSEWRTTETSSEAGSSGSFGPCRGRWCVALFLVSSSKLSLRTSHRFKPLFTLTSLPLLEALCLVTSNSRYEVVKDLLIPARPSLRGPGR
jgi:hypothetical protein